MRNGAPSKLLTLADPVDRQIAWCPPAAPYDVRHMLAGVQEGADFKGGFFDKDSFLELHANWAKTVVVGRARLGGYPMGVVAVETRTVEQVRPADPADITSQEKMIQKAGQVWYPDSAYKTSQAINDLAAEDIPLMLFANWRGFSGGMQDMFDEVLKYGAYIVDSLRHYSQPIFVYIPPHGTLRGGAWVVVDATINAQYMEMYAETTARAGILEVEGVVSIKYRTPALLKTMHRIDPELQALDAELIKASAPAEKDPKKKTKKAASARSVEELTGLIKSREQQLLPYYHTVATQFADMHDTPGRMTAKGVIRDCVPWATSRTYFYWRMRRRLLELQAVKAMQKLQADLSYDDALTWLHTSLSKHVSAEALKDDKGLTQWFEANENLVNDIVGQFKKVAVAKQVQDLVQTSGESVVDGFATAFEGLGDAQQAALLKTLNALTKK
jgi:acetyl-CoA carboxylase/biotin carboxylase 1